MSRPARWCWPAFHLLAAAWTGAFAIVVLATVPHVHEINAFIGQATGIEIEYLLVVFTWWLSVLVHESVLAGVYIAAAREGRVVRWHRHLARLSVTVHFKPGQTWNATEKSSHGIPKWAAESDRSW